MSAGNPVDARHPIRGLETGDAITWIIASGEAIARGRADHLLRQVMGDAGGSADVLVVAIPIERRAAVMESMKRGTT